MRASRTPFCVPTEPSSTKSTLLAYGGSLATSFFEQTTHFLPAQLAVCIFELRPNRWADVYCPTSDQFFKLNENIDKVPEKTTVKRQTMHGQPWLRLTLPTKRPSIRPLPLVPVPAPSNRGIRSTVARLPQLTDSKDIKHACTPC